MSRNLPVAEVVPQLVAALAEHGAAVLQAPTGAGKTTLVPLMLDRAGLAGGRRMIMLEPRRLAARVAARRMADEMGSSIGAEVGYRIRFDRVTSRRTRIEVVTEGILVRLLQDDPFLERYGLVIFDEFHERALTTDLALGMVTRVRREVRPDLKILVMSATLDAAPIAAWLGQCPVIASEGRGFPLVIRYLERIDDRPLHVQAASAVEEMFPSLTGDLLVFLPGLGEIRRTQEMLSTWARTVGALVVPLHGELPAAAQDSALQRADRPKVVLATNVAESSVTVAGITAVIDGGFARIPRRDPRVGLDRLELARISRASADQRAGRAGRTAPGVVLRLWTERQHHGLAATEEAEIRRVDLAGALLEIRAWGEGDPAAFPWFEPPTTEQIADASRVLDRLGAVSGGRLTDLGARMARLPLHPRLGRLVIEGAHLGYGLRAARLAALLAERDPRGRQGPARHRSDSDVLDRLERLEAELSRGKVTGVAHWIERTAQALVRLLARHGPAPPRDSPPPSGSEAVSSDEALLRALLAAYPDRVARRRAPGERRAVLVGGKGIVLAEESAVREPELFLCIDIDEGAGHPEALVRSASAVERSWLDATRIEAAVEVEFSREALRVEAVRRIYYDDLLLEEAPTSTPDDGRVAALLADAAGADLARALPLATSEAADFLARVRSLAAWVPELGLPRFDEDELRALLPELCRGRRSFADLQRAPLRHLLEAQLTHLQRAALEREAPERYQLPSGSWAPLAYAPGRAPVLAARIQEVFGLRETPRVARGRVPVLLHLLAPNGRPQQITDDLPSFWRTTYPTVRKELRGRYPKHAWPEDPATAVATRGPRKRKGP